MVRNTLITTCFLALAVFGAIAGQDPSQTSAPGAGQAGGADTEFATTAAHSGMAEVARARMALQKSANEEVKRYAQEIIDDHTNANNQLNDMATKKGMALPTEIGSEHQATSDRLSTLSGPNFDSEYMTLEVKEHAKALNRFQNQAQNGRDQELKSWAESMTPHLQTHQQTAHAILAKIIAAGTPATSEQMHGEHHPSEQAKSMHPDSDIDPQTSQTDPSASELSDLQTQQDMQSRSMTQETQPQSDMTQRDTESRTTEGSRTEGATDTQTDQPSMQTDQAQGASDMDLPRSASPMPLVGLLGLLSLGAAAGARFYRTSSLRAKR